MSLIQSKKAARLVMFVLSLLASLALANPAGSGAGTF